MENRNSTMSLIAGMFFFMTIPCVAQNEISAAKSKAIYSIYTQPNKKGIAEKEQALDKSKGGDAYQFMSLRKTIGALNSMISATGEQYWINQQVSIIDHLIQSAKISSQIPNNLSFKDDFKGWISLANNETYHKEVPLDEGYSFFYIMQFLFLIRHTAWLEENDSNMQWWNYTLAFI